VRPLAHAVAGCAVVLAAALPAGAGTDARALHFRVYAETGIALTDVLWTGKRFLYVENTTNEVYAAGPKGSPPSPFASMPDVVEETRCRLSPGRFGFAAGDVYCSSPDGRIYRIAPDGTSVTLFATLPASAGSDGALAFDTAGVFGHALLAATGRSGTPTDGGSVYAIDPTGRVRRVGDYPGPGGADGIATAPGGFGSAAGNVLLTVDAGGAGSVQAMDPAGRVSTLVELPDGPNPIVVVPRTRPHHRVAAPPPGLYVTDTASRSVLFAPASPLARFRGQVIVASELKGLVWVVRPSRGRFVATPLATNLAGAYNLEGATYVR
jgi:hypothetical protein